nr:uncharacterized protein LOC111856888 [Paramormyrops kingsleyae]
MLESLEINRRRSNNKMRKSLESELKKTLSSRSEQRIAMWMMKRGLLQRICRCQKCHRIMKLEKVPSPDGIRWFSQGMRLRHLDLIQDDVAKSSRTLTNMTRKLRKMCLKGLSRLQARGMTIGGPQHFVIIDESKFAHKRKYNRGRCGNTWPRMRTWVFGMLEVGGTRRRPILKLLHKQSRHHLLPIIRQYVKPGSCIISDEWRAYRDCVHDVTTTEKVTIYNNQKPWLNAEVHPLLQASSVAFRSGDTDVLRATRRDLTVAIKRTKAAYAWKAQSHFSSSDPRSMWRGIKCLTDYKPSEAQCPRDPSLPDTFYAHFKDPKTIPSSSVTTAEV